MKVFVAGGTGVLGRASLGPLVQGGHRVLSTARGKEKAERVFRLGAEPVECDLYDRESVRQSIVGCDVVIRLTTKIGSLTTLRKPDAWAETNRLRTTGARILVDAAIAGGVSTYIHESVTFVYVDGGSDWLAENAPLDDRGSAILRAAIEGEQEADRFTQSGGRGIVLRFAGFYGAGAPSTLEMIAMARRRLLPQIGRATNYFSSIYVPDAGRAVAAAVSAPAGIYNVCDNTPVTLAAHLRLLAAAVGAKPPLRLPGFLGKLMFGGVWDYFSRSQRISNTKLKEATGWQPLVKSVREGWPLVASELRERAPAQDSQRAA